MRLNRDRRVHDVCKVGCARQIRDFEMNGLHAFATAWKLGLANCLHVAAYRFRCRIGDYRRITAIAKLPRIGFALRNARPVPCERRIQHPLPLLEKAERLVKGEAEFFASRWGVVGSPPQWHVDPWTRVRWDSVGQHWSKTKEFSRKGADIKTIWELARFEWAVVLSRAFAVSRREEFLGALSEWLDSWCEHNPANAGVGWKCGQETSIRLLRFLEALTTLEWDPAVQPELEAFVTAHLRRIESTLVYAIAQDNNHGTSEAAALFIGAQWLARYAGPQLDEAQRIAALGRNQLNERIVRLVAPDGSFSQHSVNYHRMLLDTISLVEIWSRRLIVPSPFDAVCAERIRAAIDWLVSLVDSRNGDAPNLGANDGTLLLISPATPYRDHRPTLQLISCLMLERRCYESGAWDDASRLLGIEPDDYPVFRAPRRSRMFRDGGYVVLADGADSWGLLRTPTYRFRPSHADALHFDLWVGSLNVVRDTGTYSYNAEGEWMEYFSGTRGHSTCEFDGHDQMPRLGRFLYSRWLAPEHVSFSEGEEGRAAAATSYVDYTGARHRRAVTYHAGSWIVEDTLSGYERRALIRWHLAPADWVLSGKRLTSTTLALGLEVDADVEVALVQGSESRHYLERTSIPVLEILALPPRAAVRTTITILR